MSYCRWSSDDFKSDVYVYESNAGFMIHVAPNSCELKDAPPTVELTPETVSEYLARYKVISDLLKTAKRTPLPKQWAGETFCLDTAEECAELLQQMKSDGLHVPDGVIEVLMEEGKINNLGGKK